MFESRRWLVPSRWPKITVNILKSHCFHFMASLRALVVNIRDFILQFTGRHQIRRRNKRGTDFMILCRSHKPMWSTDPSHSTKWVLYFDSRNGKITSLYNINADRLLITIKRCNRQIPKTLIPCHKIGTWCHYLLLLVSQRDNKMLYIINYQRL